VFEAGLAPYKLKPIAAEVYEHTEGRFSHGVFKLNSGSRNAQAECREA